MQLITSAHSRVAETFGVAVVTASAVAALGIVLAYWTWEWLVPRPLPSAPHVAQTPVLEPAYRLFGGARTVTAPAQAGFALVGVAASAGTLPGYAIVHDGARTLVVREGDEAAPGVRVAEVHASAIVLERDGRREMLELPKRRAPAPGPTGK